MFTVFTPTFNRKHTLPTLYQSLINQTVKNFEWLVIDDGSTDGTKDLIEKYIREQKIPVRYYFQKNQGKHIAYNTALKTANEQFIMTVDSDDFLVEKALETCTEMAKEIEDRDFAGFSYLRFFTNQNENLDHYGKRRWLDSRQHSFAGKGEMGFVFRLDVAKEFKFRVIEGERFSQEALVLLPLMRKYQILFTDHVLARGDYLEDGVTQNIYKRMLSNPQYAMLTQLERIKSTRSWKEKKQFAKVYWDIANKNRQLPLFKKIIAISPLFTGITFLNKLTKHKWI